jgi:hypothetical protein
MNRINMYCAFGVFLVVALVAGQYAIIRYTATTAPPTAVAAPAPILQKFRFGVLCPDGSRVEYVATERLPKTEMCYPDPE